MNDDIEYNSLSERLVDAIPELRPAYEKELEWWRGETPGPHVIYSKILVPVMETLMETRSDDELLARIFELLEELAHSPNPRVQEVVQISGLPPRTIPRQRARRFMGPQTRALDDAKILWARRMTPDLGNGRTHVQQGREQLRHLEALLAREKLTETDRRVALEEIARLKAALEGYDRRTKPS